MLAKNVNGFTAAQVDRAVAGLDYQPSYRVRAVTVNRLLQPLREISNLILGGSRVYQDSTQDIRRGCTLNIREQDIDLDDYGTMIIGYSALFFWKFGESSGTTANDASGNGRNGTYHGGFTLGKASLLPGYTANNSVTFNGSTGYADIANASWMNVTRITLAGWWQGTGVNQTLIDRNDGGSNIFWRLEVDASGFLAFTIKFTTGSPTTKTFTASYAINDGNPHFICAVFDGSYVTLEVDGVILLRTVEIRTMNTTGTLGIRVGANNAGANFSSGTFDEWAMFGRALTAAERRDARQTGIGDLGEINYATDQLVIYMGVAMVADPDVDNEAHWAEWPLITAVMSGQANRKMDETSITRSITGQDRSVILKNQKFSSRWTVVAGENYLTGTHGVLAIAQQAGMDTNGWSVTATTATVPTTIDFEIDTLYIDAINELLAACGYRPLHFRGDGQAIVEPIKLPADRTIEDTLSTDSQSQISAEMEEATDLSQAFNVVTFYNSNPDRGVFLISTKRNTSWFSPSSIQLIGENMAIPVLLDAVNQTTLDTAAADALNRYAQIPRRVNIKTLARPFHDDEDCLQLNLTGTAPTLDISGKFINESWNLPLDIGHGDVWMDHVYREAVSVAT